MFSIFHDESVDALLLHYHSNASRDSEMHHYEEDHQLNHFSKSQNTSILVAYQKKKCVYRISMIHVLKMENKNK